MAETSKQDLWMGRISAWSASGLSRRVWCSEHGINVHTLDYWRRQLRSEPVPRKGKARTTLVPIMVAAGAAPAPTEVVLPSGVQLRIPAGADIAQVVLLVQALSAC